MKKKQKDLYEYGVDSLITTDEWDHVRYLISEELKCCDVKGGLDPADLPFFPYFEGKTKKKLIEVGFKKEIIEDKQKIKKLIYVLDFEQAQKFLHHRWDLNPPYGFPSGTYKLSEDNHTMWINSDIESALRALESITILKGLLFNNGIVNKEAVKVYLHSFELIINLSRSGAIPKKVKAEDDKQNNRQNMVDTWEQIIYTAIKNVLDKEPTRNKKKWTLGYVMMKFDIVNKGKPLYECAAAYVEQKDGKQGIRIDSLRNKTKTTFYKERSLQKFINEYKRVQSKVTL